MASGNVQFTLATGGIVSADISITIPAGTTILTANQMRKKMNAITGYTDRISPPRCSKRKGGPRSKIYCEQFAAGKHTVHVGRSATGRWYTWSDNE